MRFTIGAGVLGLWILVAAPLEADPAGDFYARIRANDAPIGGRFTIFAYMLDSLDVAAARPGPGRVLALNFRESNGDDAFVIPGDLSLEGPDKVRWTRGFFPLGEKRLAGLLPRGESRWALWWVPATLDSATWGGVTDLQLHYGFAKSIFVPLESRDSEAVLRALPWEGIAAVELDDQRQVSELAFPPDPAAFDKPPVAKERSSPMYPRSSRMYSFEGTVITVAVISAEGKVTDAFVLDSSATHDLNVSALSAVMKWVFRPGRKGGVKVGGEFVIPVRFSMGSGK